MRTVFCSRALADCGFENAPAKCGPRLDSLSACYSAFTETRVGIEPKASSRENRGMSAYGMEKQPHSDVKCSAKQMHRETHIRQAQFATAQSRARQVAGDPA